MKNKLIIKLPDGGVVKTQTCNLTVSEIPDNCYYYKPLNRVSATIDGVQDIELNYSHRDHQGIWYADKDGNYYLIKNNEKV